MPTPIHFEHLIEALALGVHNLASDQLKVALTNTLPDKETDENLADITEISYANLVGQSLTTVSCLQTAGVLKFILNDFDIEASGGNVGPFQYVVIYNDTAAADELICFLDYGSELTLLDTQKLELDFSDANGLTQLSIPSNP